MVSKNFFGEPHIILSSSGHLLSFAMISFLEALYFIVKGGLKHLNGLDGVMDYKLGKFGIFLSKIINIYV